MSGVVALVLATLIAAGLGAFAGRWLVLREIRPMVRHAAAITGRANLASARVEAISDQWPGVLEQVANLDGNVRRFIPRAQQAERQAAETATRQAELEQAIAANFSIRLAPSP